MQGHLRANALLSACLTATLALGGLPLSASALQADELPSARDLGSPDALESVGAAVVQGDNGSSVPSISGDGRYVAFQSYATNLVPGDTNGSGDVLVHDRVTGAMSRVSVQSSGAEANLASGVPSISADGRYIAFSSSATNLVDGDTNGAGDIFVHDRVTGATTRVSIDSNGAAADSFSYFPSISADGRYVAFDSLASNLVIDDTNGKRDIFVRDRVTGLTSRVNLSSMGAQANYDSSDASISADGRYVAFKSAASNLIASETIGAGGIFVHDRVTGVTTRVSIDSSGLAADSPSYSPSISADGRYVAFDSYATNLVPSDTNDKRDIFVRDRVTGLTSRVSLSSMGAQANYDSSDASISADGRYIAFRSSASNLVDGDTNGAGDIFVHDRVTGATTRVSIDSSGLAADSFSYFPSISADGRYVAFDSQATNLVAGDTNPGGTRDVFVHDTSTHETTRASVAGEEPGISDPVPVVEGNEETNEPVLVLVAGLNSETGIYDVTGGRRAGTPEDPWGNPWNYLGTLSTAGELKAADVIVIPTAKGSTDWPDSSGDGVLDSTGSLNGNMFELAGVLRSGSFKERTQGHPIILVGHSYGGVIIRSMLASGLLAEVDRERIAGVIQFGSPNGGSLAARFANTYKSNTLRLVVRSISEKCAATLDLDPATMQGWNLINGGAVGVPVVRFGGTFLPDALDIRFMRNTDHLFLLNDVMNGEPSDGVVSYTSLSAGDGSLPDQERDFGGGGVWGFPNLAHAGDIPGVGKTYYSITYEELVPQGPGSFLFPLLARKIAVLAEAHTTEGSAFSSSALDASEAAAPSDSTSSMLPSRTISISADETAEIRVSIDTSAAVLVSSAAGQPSVVVRAPGGEVQDCPVSDVMGDDGTYVSVVTLDSVTPGEHVFEVRLPTGATGDVSLSGVLSGGARLGLASSSSALASAPVAVTARFESASGAPLVGASVFGAAALNGQPDEPLTFADDGSAPDTLAGDGLYAASFTPPARGRWLVVASGFHDDAERTDSLVLDVGESLAIVTGELGEVVTGGPSGTIGSYGFSVPLQVFEEGTYTVSATLSDSAGVSAGMFRTSQRLGADESATLIASADAAHLTGIAPGPLTVGPIRITRYTDGVDLLAGSAPGFTSAASYSADDFYDFSITLSGPAANPSPTGAVHFTGTAHNTPSTVASVEYSIDGSTTWQPLEALDGAFDSSHEDFAVDLVLPDYVYGIYVRQTGADGVQLPVADWAGIRFTVDTVAPGQPTGAAALVTGEAGSQTADLSWFAADPPSDITSLVSYQVRLDGAEVGTTCGTDFDVPLPDGGLHTVSITPVDLAGNVGPSSVLELGVPVVLPPVTTLIADPTTPDGENGWYLTSPGITFSTDVAATTYYAWDSGVPAAVTGVLTAPDGEHALSYYSAVDPDNPEDAQSAVFKIDTVSPAAPAGLHAATAGPTTIDLSWDAVVDGESGTAGYLVYSADGTLLGEPTTSAFSVTGLEPVSHYSFYIKAKDNAGRIGDSSDVIGGTTGNTAPVLAPIGAKSVNEGSVLAFTATATDADVPAQTLTFSLGAGAPVGAVMSANGAFSWTPTEAQGPGVYPVTVVVSDGTASDSETIAVTVGEVPEPVSSLAPVYRFYNRTNGTHFFTDSASERDHVIATWSSIFAYEGTAYLTNPANNTTPLIRLYNKVSTSHFYTASYSEAADALAKWPTVFQLDGPTYSVNPGPVTNSLPVYRFYNLRNGSHFFTASEAEKADVIAKYPTVYRFEGPAFYIGQ